MMKMNDNMALITLPLRHGKCDEDELSIKNKVSLNQIGQRLAV
jgi:hypothetical protein